MSTVKFLGALVGLGLVTLNLSSAQAQTTAILVPGAGGAVPIDFLVRNKGAIERTGIPAVIAVSAGEIAQHANSAKQGGRKVVIVAMSKGSQQTTQALVSGVVADGVVFVSAVDLGGVAQRFGSPAKLPPTLVVHNQNDACPLTTPASAADFVKWSAGKARLVWVNETGGADPRPCGPTGAHGFYQKDGAAVAAITGFIRSR